MAVATFGSFGSSLDDAVRSEFFAFFHLAENGRVLNPDDTVTVNYRTGAPAWRELVGLALTTASDGKTVRMSLSISSRFLTHPADRPFARDFVRSFVSSGMATAHDAEVLRDLLVDLQFRPDDEPTNSNGGGGPSDPDALIADLLTAVDRGEVVAVNLGGPKQSSPLAEVASRGFAVYRGDRAAFARDLDLTSFAMANDGEGVDRWLMVDFTRRPGG